MEYVDTCCHNKTHVASNKIGFILYITSETGVVNVEDEVNVTENGFMKKLNPTSVI